MSLIIPILNFEEGYVDAPYLDTQGFPTVAGGIRIGPKGASLSNYSFRVPRQVGDIWKHCILESKASEMEKRPVLSQALAQCNEPRRDVLYSMAYQLGVDGLAAFNETLKMVAAGDFTGAANGMLNSLWARQTPGRARRHAEVMRTGTYDVYKGLL